MELKIKKENVEYTNLRKQENTFFDSSSHLVTPKK